MLIPAPVAMAATNDPGYSTLEYVPPTEFYNKKENALPVYSGLQVVPETPKEAHITSDGLEVAPKHDAPVYNGSGDADHVLPPPPQPAKSRRKWLIVGGVVLLLAIIGGVVGGVMASKSSKNSNTADTSAAAISDAGSSSSSTSTYSSSGTAKPTATTQPRRNIAAVSWNSSPANQTRMYFQNNAGEIVEAVVAGSKTSSSVLEADSKPGVALVKDGKPGSPLAAAVSRPGIASFVSLTEF